MSYIQYAVILSCFILLVFLLLAEVKRINKDNLLLRLLANIIAVSSLALLFIPLTYKVDIEVDHSLNIFTPGTNQDSVPKSLRKGYALASIPDLSYLLKSRPEISSVNVFGYGLAPSDLEALKYYKLNFYPSAPSGIVSVRWNSRLSYTEKLQIQGKYINSSSNEVKLVLRGFGDSLDSAFIPAGKTSTFSLKTIPKQAGKAVLNLFAYADGKLLVEEKVPIEVTESKPMTILLLSSNPDFEYKFLKNWLFEEGHALMMRSRISKTAISSDFLNTKPVDLKIISGDILKKIDVLIADEEELATISNQEYQQIEQAVAKGMGLCIRISQPNIPRSLAITRNLARYELKSANDKEEQSLFLRPANTALAALKDKAGRIIAAKSLYGKGKVTGLVSLTTYKWLLESKESTYKRYWSDIVGGSATMKSGSAPFEIFPQFPIVQQTFRVNARQVSLTVPTIRLNNVVLAPRQNVVLSNDWDAIADAKSVGWNRVNINGKEGSFFVYDKDSWQNLRNSAKIKANVAASEFSQPLKSAKLLKTIEKRFPVWIFYLLFALSSGFLWLEPKLSYRNGN
jgi:hypothetical protein